MSVAAMSWVVSFAIALLSGIVALFASGVVADRCVGWYRISSFEGGSGYFVVFVALAGGLAGTVVGLAVARLAAPRLALGAWRAAALAVIVVLGIAGAVAGLARALADVPPEIAGERLYLLVEIRWPSGTRPPAPAIGPGVLRLGARSGATLRRAELGPLFLEDAREDAGTWIVPGAVEIFTTRGTRVLDVLAGTTQVASILLPLRRVPVAADLEWSDWMPGTGGRQVSAGIPVSYRFRVSPRSAPMRRQVVGPFTVETRVREVFRTGGTDALSARSAFDIRHRGVVVAGPGETTEVAVIARAPAVLLARGGAGCRLVRETSDDVATVDGPPCLSDAPTWRLTPPRSGTGVAHGGAPETTGWLDTRTFATPGLYLLGPAILDTRTLVMSPRGWPPEPTHVLEMPPMALSPDERSMAWYTPGDTETPPAIAVMRLDTGATATLPLDRARMRYRAPQLDLDAAWLDHHYAWERGQDGADQLVVRETFTPLPHRGALTLGRSGEYQSYDIQPGGPGLQRAVRDVLLSDLRAQSLPDEYGTLKVRLDGIDYGVQYVDSTATVAVFTYKGTPDAMSRIGAQLDRVLASGRLDALLVAEAPR